MKKPAYYIYIILECIRIAFPFICVLFFIVVGIVFKSTMSLTLGVAGVISMLVIGFIELHEWARNNKD